jgi:hypothetical protein
MADAGAGVSVVFAPEIVAIPTEKQPSQEKIVETTDDMGFSRLNCRSAVKNPERRRTRIDPERRRTRRSRRTWPWMDESVVCKYAPQ